MQIYEKKSERYYITNPILTFINLTGTDICE